MPCPEASFPACSIALIETAFFDAMNKHELAGERRSHGLTRIERGLVLDWRDGRMPDQIKNEKEDPVLIRGKAQGELAIHPDEFAEPCP